MTDLQYEQHAHEALVHSHEHFHVTHNWSDQAQTFVHLTSQHSHDHDHAPIEHAHFAHQDFDSEHRGEAHVHDHGESVARRQPTDAATAKKTAKKATAKKTTAKKATAKKAT